MKSKRNSPCPCGSGRKHKLCCGRNPSLQGKLEQALQVHQSGRLEQAEALYRSILSSHPDCADALHLLGLLAYARGQWQEARNCIASALGINPLVAEFHNNYANVLKQLGKIEEAFESYQRALALNPRYADAHNNLGLLLKQRGDLEGAAAHYRRAIELQPSHAMAYSNLGAVLQSLSRTGEAFEAHRKAIAMAPASPGVWTSAGVTLLEAGKPDEAIRCHRQALQIQPDFVDALVNLGNALSRVGQASQALAQYQRALQLQPGNALILNNMGALLEGQGHVNEALACYRRALESDPKLAATYSNLGAAVKKLGKLEEALQYYEQAVELDPSFAQARWNRALALLASGRLEQGWQEYEWGWISQGRKPQRAFPQPRWAGEHLEGKTILVHGEQGVGDEILFASMLPDLLEQGAKLVVECDPRLAALFQRSFAGAEVVPRTDPPHPRTLSSEIDYFSPAGSLSRFLRPSLAHFPGHAGYLRADPRRQAEFRRRLEALGRGWKVGICWRSRMQTPTRSLEYTALSQWGPILQVPGVHFVNLQYDDCRVELEDARRRFGVQIHSMEDLDLLNDLDGAAALTSALDLVITAATAVASTAGALGKTVWQYQFVPTGDWLTLGASYIPWFPSTRRFDRQPDQQWDAVIALVAEELSRLACRFPPPQSSAGARDRW